MCNTRKLYIYMLICPREKQKKIPAGRRLLNKLICYKTVLLLVLSPRHMYNKERTHLLHLY